jgi:hypothetical protein
MAVAVLLLMAQFAAASHGELRLVVRDPSGLPLRAAIEITSEGTRIREQTEASADGRAVLRRLPFGIYRVVVSAGGFASATGLVEIRSAAPVERQFSLAVAPIQTSVTVGAGDTLLDPHQTTPVQRIGLARLQERPATTAGRALVDIVNSEPGWLLEANGVLHPRGSEYDTQYIVDGLPLTDNRSPAFAPALAGESVRSLAILTGGYPAEYGRKLGGVIEIVTDASGRRGVEAEGALTVAHFGTREAEGSVGYATEAQSVLVSGGASSTDRFLDPPVEENFTNTGTAARAAIRWEGDASPAHRFGLIARHGRSEFLVPNELVQQAAGQEQSRANRETAAHVSYRGLFSSRAVGELVGMGRRLAADLESNAASTPLLVKQDRSLSEGYVKGAISFQHGRHEIKGGADVVRARVRESLSYAVVDPERFDPETPASFDFRDEAVDREQSLFLQDQIRSGPWTVNAGVRWDRYDFRVRETAWSPRVAVARALPQAGVVLRASYDRIFQTPAVENLLLASSAESDELSDEAVRLPVRPSRGHFAEVGISKALFGAGRLDASYFARRLKHFGDDDLLLNTGVSFPMAFGRARVSGAELKLDVRAAGRWSGSLAYGYLRALGEFPITGGLVLDDDDAGAAGEEFPISQDQRHTARARLRVALPRSWIAIALAYGSGLPFEFADSLEDALAQYGARTVSRVDFATGRVRPSASLDLSGGATVMQRGGRSLRLYADARNLTNRFDVINFAGLFSGTAVAPPRSVGLRIAAQF